MPEYNGHYGYDEANITNWNAEPIGVYYCGYVSNGTLIVHYVGRAIGEGGIRRRLLEHLRDDHWPDVSAFGYAICANDQEAIDFEVAEITRLQPKYNIQGRSPRFVRT